MKNKVIKIISYIIFISIIFSVFMPISNALDFENIKGSGTGSNNNASSVSGTGYFVPSTTQQAIVGFRFSVVDSDGNLKLKTDGNNSRTIDMYLSNSSYGSTIYNSTTKIYNVFNSVKNKFQCKSLIESGKTFTMGAYPKMGSNDGSFEITNNTVPTNNDTYKDNNKVIDTDISTMSTWNTNSTVSTDITSLVQTWLKGTNNDYAPMKEIAKKCGITNVTEFQTGDYILAEPLFLVSLDYTYYVMTTSEMGLFATLIYGADADLETKRTSTDGTYGFLLKQLHQYFASYVISESFAGLTEGSTNLIKKDKVASAKDMIKKTYGIIAIRLTQDNIVTNSTLTINYYANGGTMVSGETNSPLLTVSFDYSTATNSTLKEYGLANYANGGSLHMTRDYYKGTGNWLIGSTNTTISQDPSSDWDTVAELAYELGVLSDLEAGKNASVDLYAEWRPNQLYIEYYANGGFVVGYDYGTSMILREEVYTYGSATDTKNLMQYGLTNYGPTANLIKLYKDSYVATGNWIIGTQSSATKLHQDKTYTSIYNFADNLGVVDSLRTNATTTVRVYAEWMPLLTIAYDCSLDIDTVSMAGSKYFFGDYNRICSTSVSNNKTIWGTANVVYQEIAGNAALGENGLYNFATFDINAPSGKRFKCWKNSANKTFDESTSYTAEQLVEGTGYDIKNNPEVIWMTAVFEDIPVSSYTVRYDQNTTDSVSNMPSSQTKNHDVNLILSSNIPTRTGYTFNGWKTQPNGGTSYSAGGIYSTNADVTLYAQWKKIPVLTIAYDCYGKNVTVQSGSSYFLSSDGNKRICTTSGNNKTISGTPNVFYHTLTYNNAIGGNGLYNFATFKLNPPSGYKFKCWKNAANVEFDQDDATLKPSDLTQGLTGADIKDGDKIIFLTAVFEQIPTYTVAYNQNTTDSVSNMPSSQTKTHDVNLILSSNIPTRTGYTFNGWKTQPNGGTSYSAGGIYSTNANVTLYAQWTPITYTIAFDGNGATSGSMGNITMTFDAINSTAITNIFERTGYDFAGWSITGMTDDVTHYRGKNTNVGTDFKGTYFPKENETFSKSTYFKNLRSTSGTVTLTAQWTPIPYIITYNINGGTFYDKSSDTIKTVSYTIEDNKKSKPTPTKEESVFDGWKVTLADGAWHLNDVYAASTNFGPNKFGDVTLTAQWTPVYTVSYDKNTTDTVSDMPSSQTKNHDVNLILSSNIPTRTGYTFNGWKTQPNGGTSYSAGSTYSANASVTLYAQWTPNELKVYYNANGGFVSDDKSQTYTLNSNDDIFKNGSRHFQKWTYNTPKENGLTNASTFGLYKTGYTFKCWKNSNGDEFGQNDSSIVPTDLNPNITSGNVEIVLYAVWTPNSYTVTYNGNEATSGSMENSSATYGENFVTRPNVFTRTGYVFNGWNEKADGTGVPWRLTSTGVYENGNGTNPWVWSYDYDITLYAQWTPITYTITYKWSDGTAITSLPPTSYTVEDAVTLPTVPIATGYTTDGWYTSSDCTTKANNIPVGTTGNKTFYAKKTAYTLTIKYYDEETLLKTSGPYPYNATDFYRYGLYNYNASKTGYILSSEWLCKDTNKTLSNGDNLAQCRTTQAIAEHFGYDLTKSDVIINLYTQWTPITYQIKYDGNGATSGSMSNSTHTYDEAKNLTANAYQRTGYTFSGWATSANGSVVYEDSASVKNLSSTQNEVITLYAQWTPNKLKVYYNATGGLISDEKSLTYTLTNDDVYKNGTRYTQTWTYNESKENGLTNASTFGLYKTGYKFKCWRNTNGDEFKQNNSAIVPTDLNPNITNGNVETVLYAVWTPITYEVSYNGNGATSGSMSNSTHTYDEAKNLTANAYQRTGYTFSGWATSANGSVIYEDSASVKNLSSTQGEVITLYAQWTPITYQIKYDGNGATSGSMSNSTHTYDEAKNLTANAYQKTGYTFVGWSTSANGSVVYANSVSVKNLASTQDAVVNLYAQWAPITYQIKYNGNGATSGSMNNSTHTYDEASELTKNTYAKTGYSFVNWNTEPNGTGTSYSDEQTVKNLASKQNEVITLYAQWEANTYYVYLYPNGGIKAPDTTFTPSDNKMVKWEWESAENRWKAYYIYDSGNYVSIPGNNAAFTYTGYSQDGWKEDNKTAFAETKYSGPKDLHLYAVWQTNNNTEDKNTAYTISHMRYNNTTGEYELFESSTIPSNINDNVALTPKSYYGYKCIEATAFFEIGDWKYSQTFENPSSVTVRTIQDNGTKVTFYYKLDTCVVTYVLNGGIDIADNSGNDKNITCLYFDTIKHITPEKEGYIFNGWYLYVDDNGASGYQGGAGENYTVTSSVTLYAYWIKDPNFVDLQIVYNKIYGDIIPDSTISASATILNYADKDMSPTENVKVKLSVGTVVSGTFTKFFEDSKQVIVPAKNKNLVYVPVQIPTNIPVDAELQFKWEIDLSDSEIVDVITFNNQDSNIVYNESTKETEVKQQLKTIAYGKNSTTATPEFTITPPSTYSSINPSSTSINTYNWDIWEYKNGKFEIVNYKSEPLLNTPTSITLIPENIEGLINYTNSNDYTTRSGYGFSINMNYSISNDVTIGNLRVSLLCPEFNYSKEMNNFEDLLILNKNANKTSTVYSLALRPSDKETSMGIHYTPMWYPDKTYQPITSIGGMWTPIGEVQANIVQGDLTDAQSNVYGVKTNKVTISGSLYDDMYIVNDHFDENIQ